MSSRTHMILPITHTLKCESISSILEPRHSLYYSKCAHWRQEIKHASPLLPEVLSTEEGNGSRVWRQPCFFNNEDSLTQ